MNQYYIRFGQRISGPVGIEQLRHMAETGQITNAHMISVNGRDWVASRKVEGLFQDTESVSASNGMDMQNNGQAGFAERRHWHSGMVNSAPKVGAAHESFQNFHSTGSEDIGDLENVTSESVVYGRRAGTLKMKAESATFKDLFFEYFLPNLKNYGNFSGRVSRREYWFFQLFNFMAFIAVAIVEGMIRIDEGTLAGLYLLGILVPTLGMTLRRLHDMGKNFPWMLYPIGFFVLGVVIGGSMMIGGYGDPFIDLGNIIRPRTQLALARLSLILSGVSTLVLFIFTVKEGDGKTNEFGPNPRFEK